jgi:hypothetical protein
MKKHMNDESKSYAVKESSHIVSKMDRVKHDRLLHREFIS